MSERLVNLDKDQYGELLRCVSILKDECNDADIRNGVIRQRSNEKISVFEIDLSNIISDINIPITDLKRKIDLLKIFEGGEVTITIDETTNPASFSFSDEYSSLKFLFTRLDFMDNKYLTEEELQASFILDESDVILNTSIPKNISDRIRIVCQSFSINSIQILLEEGTASLVAKTQSKDQFAKFYSGIVVDRPMTAFANIVAIPFMIDHDTDVSFKMYNVRGNIIVNKFTTSIMNTGITIYTRGSLVTEDE